MIKSLIIIWVLVALIGNSLSWSFAYFPPARSLPGPPAPFFFAYINILLVDKGVWLYIIITVIKIIRNYIFNFIIYKFIIIKLKKYIL